jgi:hypothetical protein
MAQSQYAGMTVNERLFTAGLLRDWDRAINSGDREAAIDILNRVDVDNASATVDTVLANPGFYGFRRTGPTS